MDPKKKEQQRALQRLQNLEEWQKRMKERELGSDTSSMKARSEMQQTSSETISIASSLDRPGPRNYEYAEFDKLYDPYKVRIWVFIKD